MTPLCLVTFFMVTVLTEGSVGTSSGSLQVKVQYPTIPKCCPVGSSISSIDGIDCFNYSNKSHYWKPFFYDSTDLTRLGSDEENNVIPSYFHSVLSCEDAHSTQSSPTHKFHEMIKVRSDGRVKRFCRFCPCKKWILVNSEFCIDGFGEIVTSDEMFYSGSEDDQIFLMCEPVKSKNKTVELVFTICFFTSAVFYFIMVLIYASLWENQSTQGRTVFGLLASRLGMCLFLGIANLFYVNGDVEETTSMFCKIIGIFAHFFVLSSFTWLAVLCFDLWITFRHTQMVDRNTKVTKTFLCYIAIALGIPFIAVTISVILNENYRGSSTEFWIPNYGAGVCYVASCASGIYVFSIIGTLLSVSFVFSVLTIRTIFNTRKATREVRSAKNTRGYFLYGKLVLVMGLTWVLEFLSWAVLPDDEPQRWYWILIDVFNVLISTVLIFIVFICKRQIVKQLTTKYHTLEVCVQFATDVWDSVQNRFWFTTGPSNQARSNPVVS